MNLQALVALAEIVSALAVTLTLIALIVTIRQNTRSQKALAVDSLAAAITSINVPAMESPALGAAISKAATDWASATREERIMAHYFLFSFFKLLENARYLQKAGILDEAQGESFPLEQYQRDLKEKNPNFIPYFGFSRSRTEECTVPTEISYCPSCQAAYEGLSVY